jgi:bacillithiol biosynthesis cysteine-adding enzyme BshC
VPPLPFTPAWLAKEPVALSLLEREFQDPAGRARAVARAAARRVHPAVLQAMTATTEAQRAAREALARPGTAAVVTGQQAGLFGGPLYTLYKAAAAIVDARALEAETGTPCVPVFWLQDEDHDFDEIASCAVLGADGALHTVRVEASPGEEGRSIASRTLGPSVLAALDQTQGLLQGLSEAGPAMELLRSCYTPEASPSEAFRRWIEALFAPHGLLVLDPAHPALAEAARPVHLRALEQAEPISALLRQRSQELEQAGFSVQVHVRPGAPLSFFHPDGRDGPRYRVEPRGAELMLCGPERAVSREAMAQGFCSTSALLRPILQDSWLPTAAYVGGPGEIAYFAQLPPLYQAMELPMPMLIPRARLAVVDETSQRLLSQLGLQRAELSEPRERLLARLGRGNEALDLAEIESLQRQAQETLAAFAPRAQALDKALARAADKTREGVADSLARLLERAQRTLAQRDAVTIERLDRLLARLLPGGEPQERVHAWPWYGARFGAQAFVSQVLAQVRPFDGALAEMLP